jgi:hypothetical protein
MRAPFEAHSLQLFDVYDGVCEARVVEAGVRLDGHGGTVGAAVDGWGWLEMDWHGYWDDVNNIEKRLQCKNILT